MSLAPCIASAASLSGPEANLLPPVSSACISSPFGPRILANRPLAGTYNYGVDMPAPAGAPVSATGPGRVLRIQRKGPGGLEVVVQHDGFVGIYSHLGMVTPALAGGKTTVAAGEKLGVVGHSGLTYGMASCTSRCCGQAGRWIPHPISACRSASAVCIGRRPT